MVRVGGLNYEIDPNAEMGKRISKMELDGKPVDASKEYPVGGWASVAQPLEGEQIWDLVARNLRSRKVISSIETNVPKIKGMDANPGYAKG